MRLIKSIFATTLIALFAHPLYAQLGDWTWLSGDSIPDQYGVYGTLGSASASNSPGARSNAVSWVDTSGNLWMFGGEGYANSGSANYLNDLWMFDASDSVWTWVNGDSSVYQNGIYGTMGAASASNKPGARYNAISWVDDQNNLWLFAGYGLTSSGEGRLSDLWKYSISSNQWTWVKGADATNQLGVYGTQGTSSASNLPGTRMSAVSWTDSNNVLWLFGGIGKGSTSSTGRLNDLWKFDPSSNMWTWVNGSNVINIPGSYGTQGSASATNVPGSRERATGWTDNSGNLWLFSGIARDSVGNLGNMNDLWSYSIASNQWTWVNGATIWQDADDVYGTLGQSTSSTTPGGRWGSEGLITDDGKVYIFGGYGNAYFGVGDMNDLWEYNSGTNTWTWVGGYKSPDQNGTYATFQNSNASNQPGSRNEFSLWSTTDGIYIFGGNGYSSSTGGYGWLNDMWLLDFPTCQLSVSIPTINHVLCKGENSGSATAVDTGGIGSVTYTWNEGSSTAAISGLSAGMYTVTVEDGNGCTAAASIAISEPDSALNVSITSSTNVSCFGGTNGAAQASANGGSGSKTYAWSNTSTAISISGLVAGTYTVTASDTNGCNATSTVSITQPYALITNTSSQTNVSCNGGSDGSVTVITTGGTGNKTYAWSNSATGATITGLAAGTYTVTAIDSNSCVDTASINITQPNAISITITPTHVSCNGGSNGAASANAAGGTGGKTYLWSNGGNTATITGLSMGNYSVTVTDANGCTAVSNTSISQPTALGASITSQSNVDCFGESTGSATVTSSGGTTGYSYFWSGGGSNATKTGLSAGTFTVTVTDANGCTATSNATIIQPSSPIALTVSSTPVLCNGDSNGTASATGTGGTGSITYEWNTSATASSISGLTAGTFTVTASDANSCTATGSTTITDPTELTVSIIFSVDALCFGEPNGSATASATGGSGQISYVWSNGNTNASATGLTAAAYAVTASDSNGCEADAIVSINQPDPLLSTLVVTREVCAGDANGSINSTTTGGTIPYNYSWNDSQNQSTSNATNLAAGTYDLTVTDFHGCTSVSSETVNTGSPLPQPSLGGDTIITTGGGYNLNPGNFVSYLWQDGSTSATYTATTTGNYWVVVTDTEGCEGSDSVRVKFWPTGIVDLVQDDISFYPNPATDRITIISDHPFEGHKCVQLVNVHGQVVLTENFSGTSTSAEIELFDLASGSYFLKVIDNKTIKVFSLVLN